MIHKPSSDGGWRVMSIQLRCVDDDVVTSKPKYRWIWKRVHPWPLTSPLSRENAFRLYLEQREIVEMGYTMAARLIAPDGVVVAEQYGDRVVMGRIVWPETWRVVGKVRFGRGGIG